MDGSTREEHMAGIVVRTLEELQSAQKTRPLPTIVVEGELVNNLLIQE